MSTPAPEQPTRQQLDELDALLQRMLALPVNTADGELQDDVPPGGPVTQVVGPLPFDPGPVRPDPRPDAVPPPAAVRGVPPPAPPRIADGPAAARPAAVAGPAPRWLWQS